MNPFKINPTIEENDSALIMSSENKITKSQHLEESPWTFRKSFSSYDRHSGSMNNIE